MTQSRNTKIQPTQLNSHQQKFVREHHHCPMCDNVLEIKHDVKNLQPTNEAPDTPKTIREIAYCSTCGIPARNEIAKLH